MKKNALVMAVKGHKTKLLYSWEQVSYYQNRGWKITMVR